MRPSLIVHFFCVCLAFETPSLFSRRRGPVHIRPVQVRSGPARLFSRGGQKLSPPIGNKLSLSSEESALFNILNDVARQDGTTLRVAGGWVRDRLLRDQPVRATLERGLYVDHSEESDERGGKDIDLALDDQLGSEFAAKVSAWLEEHGEGAAAGVATILKNPEKSKHLETATMNLRGFSIDFVNLRTEEYCDDSSRIPSQMDIGTPVEDALRRDLTINALFYNLRTGEVEDLTGRGIEHLTRRLVATPLPPMVTLLDDPLRLLRAVRFASRLGFRLDKALLLAAKSGEVRSALGSKVSRERIGHEFDLMISNPRRGAVESQMTGPVRAMRVLHALEVAPVVLLEPRALYVANKEGGASLLPSNASSSLARCGVALQAVECADALLSGNRHDLLRFTLGLAAPDRLSNLSSSSSSSSLANERGGNPSQAQGGRTVSVNAERRLVLFACMFLPWADLLVSKQELKGAPLTGKSADLTVDNMSSLVPALSYLTSKGLKLSRHDTHALSTIHDASRRFSNLLGLSSSSDNNNNNNSSSRMARRPCRRSEAGFALRLAGPLWRAALLVAIVNETIGVDRGEGHSLISRSAIPPPKQHEPLSLEEVANRGGSPVADELSAAVTREMQASALFAALTKWMDNEGLLGSTVSIHRAIATGRPSLAAWEVAPIFNGNEVAEILPRLPKGPQVREVLDAMLQWQLSQRDVYAAAVELQVVAREGAGVPSDCAGRAARSKVEEMAVGFLEESFPAYLTPC